MEIAVQSGTVRRSHGVFGFHAVVVADARASHGDGRAKKGNGNHNGKQLPCASENGLAYRDHILRLNVVPIVEHNTAWL
jgi:hypothetical protein